MTTRSKILSAALIAAVFAGGTAMASGIQGAFAQIKAIDLASNSVTLTDGETYVLPFGVSAASLSVGERVALQWITQGDDRAAVTVTAQ